MALSKEEKYFTAVTLLLQGKSSSEIIDELAISKTTLVKLRQMIKEREITQASLAKLTLQEFKGYLPKRKEVAIDPDIYVPDFSEVARKLRTSKRSNRKIMFESYLEEAASYGKPSYSYQTFCKKLKQYCLANNISYTFKHAPAETAQVDWVGDTITFFDREQAKEVKAYIIVFVLPYSGLIYARAYRDMKSASWLHAHGMFFKEIGGVPYTIICDNCKTAVIKRHPEIVLNKSYEHLIEHYNSSVLPGRSVRPRDKAACERAVQTIETRFIAKVEDVTFYSLKELNECLEDAVDTINEGANSDGVSRITAFLEEEKELLRPLPERLLFNFELKSCKVGPDYHIHIGANRYSVPYTLVSKTVKAIETTDAVDIYLETQFICTHLKQNLERHYCTLQEHMPKSHMAVGSIWSRDHFLEAACRIGANTYELFRRYMDDRTYPEQGFVACRNSCTLMNKYSAHLIEKAAAEVLKQGGLPYYTSFKRALLAAQKQEEKTSQNNVQEEDLQQNLPKSPAGLRNQRSDFENLF